MNKITNLFELPEWFNIDNYLCAKNFRPFEWYLQLASRRYFYELLGYRNETSNPDLPKLASQSLETYTSMAWGKDLAETHYVHPSLSTKKRLFDHLMSDGLAVSSLTLRNLTNYKSNISELHEWIDELGAKWNRQPDDTFNPADAPIMIADWPHEPPCFATARVNMSLPDKVILESFTAWLALARESNKPKLEKKHQQLPFERWARFRILALLDLEIWCLKTGRDLPDHILSAALFPNADSGPDNIRKTIRPIAHRLVEDLSELKAIAALDISNWMLADNPEN